MVSASTVVALLGSTLLGSPLLGSTLPGGVDLRVGSLLVAAAVVLLPTWRVVRLVVTVAHEAGHALVAVLVGRRLSGVRLHSDTSGLTVSRGRPTGLGMVATCTAGYPAPTLLALAASAAVQRGWVTQTLWVALAGLALLLVMVRNLFGLLVTVVLGVGLWFVVHGDAQARLAATDLLIWVLVLGGLRASLELAGARRRSNTTDADQLARLTHIPGVLWWLAFVAVAALGAWWSIRPLLPASL